MAGFAQSRYRMIPRLRWTRSVSVGAFRRSTAARILRCPIRLCRIPSGLGWPIGRNRAGRGIVGFPCHGRFVQQVGDRTRQPDFARPVGPFGPPPASACRTTFDIYRGQAMPGQPAQWCARYGLQATSTYAISAHSDDLAKLLAIAWCSKRQPLYDI